VIAARALRRLVVLALAMGVTVAFVARDESDAVAATSAHADASVDVTKVEVGDVARYTLTVSLSGGAGASEADPGKIEGLRIVGTSQSVSRSPVVRNGVLENNTTQSVTFSLLAEKLGKHTLGPGSITVGGVKLPTPRLTIEVVPRGKAPRTRRPRDPFFDNPFFRDDDGGAAPPEPTRPPEVAPNDKAAAIDAVPDDPAERNAFARIVVDKKRAVVGEPVEVKLFLYVRGHPQPSVRKPPGFASWALVDLGQLDREWRAITIGRELWSYGLISHWAAYPLQTGELAIEPAEIDLSRSSPFDTFGDNETRSTPRVTVTVDAAPSDGRPNAFVEGDVAANLALEAEVTPRESKDGHVLVSLRMRGEGRLDGLRPILPTPAGGAWTPTVDEARTQVENVDAPISPKVLGARKLSWDLAFDRGADLDLGDAVVTVWNWRDRSYDAVHVALGRVHVTAKENATAVASADPFPLPAARTELGPRASGAPRGDSMLPWAIAGGAPIAVLALQGLAIRVGRMRRDRAARAATTDARLARALETARKAGDASAWMRALDLAIELRANVVARAETRAALEAALTAAGVVGHDEIVGTRAALEDARFAGAAMPPIERVERVIRALSERTDRAQPSTGERT
jgi:hypothetical protein